MNSFLGVEGEQDSQAIIRREGKVGKWEQKQRLLVKMSCEVRNAHCQRAKR